MTRAGTLARSPRDDVLAAAFAAALEKVEKVEKSGPGIDMQILLIDLILAGDDDRKRLEMLLAGADRYHLEQIAAWLVIRARKRGMFDLDECRRIGIDLAALKRDPQ